jgi:HSP20 family protein
MCPEDDQIIKDIRYLQETMEKLLSDFSGLRTPPLLGKVAVWRPFTDVYDTAKEIVVRMEVAGIDTADLEVTLSDRVLTIRGVRRDATPAVKKHFHKMEIRLGPFERNIEFPADVQISGADAHYENGYLVVRLTKGARRGSRRARMISVEEG